MEKANVLINIMIADKKIDYLKSVVIDELHLISDEQRGYLMELILTKLISLGDRGP